MIKRIINHLFTFLTKHERIGALFVFVSVIAFIYAPVIFAHKSFQSPIYFPNTVTENGAFGYDGRKPYKSFDVDLTSATITELPINSLIGNILKSGKLPLWNPYKGVGEPLPEQLGSAALFPYQMLEDILPPTWWDFFMLGRLLIVGFFVFLFLRFLGTSKLAAILGGLIYMFSGTFTWFINNEPMVNPAMMLPVSLWGIERLLRRPAISTLAGAAACLGLLILSGAPGVIVYGFLLLGTYAIFRIVTSRSYDVIFRSFLVVLAFVFGIVIAFPLILPFFNFLKISVDFRGGTGLLTLSPVYLNFILFPGLTDVPINYFLGVGNGLWDSLGSYTGILTAYLLISGVVAYFLVKNNARKKYFMFFFIAGCAIILKNYGIPPFLFLGKLPAFNDIWSPRWSGPTWGLSFALASGVAFDMLKKHLFEIRNRLHKILYFPPLPIFGIGLLLVLANLWFWRLPKFILEQRQKVLAFLSSVSPLSLPESIFYFTAVMAIIFLITYLLFYSKKEKQSIVYALFILAIVEFWLWVPRGYESATLKSIPFIVGIFMVISIILGQKKITFLLGIAFLALFITADSLSPFGLPTRYNPFTSAPYIDFLKKQTDQARVLGTRGVLMPNIASAFDINDFRHIDAAINKNLYEFKKEVLGSQDYGLWLLNTGILDNSLASPPEPDICNNELLPPPTSASAIFKKRLPFYSLLGIRYFLLPRDAKISDAIDPKSNVRFPLVYDKEIRIYENPFVIPRVFVVNNVIYAKNSNEVFKILKTIEKPGEQVVLEEPLSKGISPTRPEYTAHIKSYKPLKVAIKVTTKAPGLVVFTDLFYPGWEVKIDGMLGKIYKVDGLFRGVYVGSGAHEIIFEYHSKNFDLGLILALAVFTSFGLGSWISFKTRNKYFIFLPISITFLIGGFILSKTALDYFADKEQVHGITNGKNQNGVLADRQWQEASFVSRNLSSMIPESQVNATMKIIGFHFLPNSPSVFLVDYQAGNKLMKIAVRVLKDHDPDYSYGREFLPLTNYMFGKYVQNLMLGNVKAVAPLSLMQDIGKMGILRMAFYFWAKDGKLLETKLYVATALYEFENGKWILKQGKEAGGAFDNAISYVCPTKYNLSQ